MPRGKLAAVDHVGGEQVVVRTEQVLSETHTIRVVFLDFANLPHNRDEVTKSSVVLCHGYQWKLILYPGGDLRSSSNMVCLSAYLSCVSAEKDDCQVKAEFIIRELSTAAGGDVESWNVDNIFDDESSVLGWEDFRLRSDVLDPSSKGFLVDGNLTIEVDLQVYVDKPPLWGPKNELNLDMLQLLELAGQSGDVDLTFFKCVLLH
jgi:hypothetical protein